jgi:hypothetical protein
MLYFLRQWIAALVRDIALTGRAINIHQRLFDICWSPRELQSATY